MYSAYDLGNSARSGDGMHCFRQERSEPPNFCMQILVADRLIEARSEAMNGHVFNVVSSERLTNLRKEPDLVPLTRRERTCMSEGILFQDAAPLPSKASNRASSDFSVPQAPLTSLKSMRERTDSFRIDSLRGARLNSVSSVNGRHLEDTPGSSPRVAADTGKEPQVGAILAASVHDQRQLFFGRNQGPSRVSGFW